MFSLSLLALKYSYFRRGRMKSVTEADRGEREKKEDREQERKGERGKLME